MLARFYNIDLQAYGLRIINAIGRWEIKQKLDEAELLSAVEALRHKKGRVIFYKWRRRQLNKMEELEEANLNVFEKLRRQRDKKMNTVFSKLQRFRKN